jgi:hypothetical protein
MRQDDELRNQCKIKIRKKYAGHVKYSDVIGKDRKTIWLWRLIQTRLHDRSVDTRKIRRLMQLMDQPNALCMTHAQVDAAQSQTNKLYKEHKKIQTKLRNEFSSKVNQRRAKKYNTSEEAQNTITKNAFCSKTCFRRINAVLEKKVQAAFTFVEWTDEFGIVTESTSNADIYQACKDEWQARYDQANSTPFMSTTLLDVFGTLSNQEAIDQVLDGTLPIMDTVFEWNADTWIQRDRNPSNQPTRFQGFRRTMYHTDELPPDALPNTAYGSQIVYIQGTAPISVPDDPEADQKWWNEIVHIPIDLQPLLTGIRNGTAVCVTDGLYKHTYDAAALIILPYLEAPEGVILVNQTPGLHLDVDAEQNSVVFMAALLILLNSPLSITLLQARLP